MSPRSTPREPVQPRCRFTRGTLAAAVVLLVAGCGLADPEPGTPTASTAPAAAACATLRSAVSDVSTHLAGVRAGEPTALAALAEGTETLRTLAASLQGLGDERLATDLVAGITAAYAAHAALLAAASTRPALRRAVSDAEVTRTDAVEAALAACS